MIVSNPAEYSCALYCRLSNEDELQGESQSITNQRELLKRYAKENDLNIYDIYIDDGYSGTNFARPDFQRMIKDIENKKVNMVIVKDSSRLGRDYIQFGEYIEKYFPQNNIRVISILDNYDSAIDNGVADTLPFKAVMNDFYAKDTSKKVRSTKLKNAKQGLFMGRYAPFGYEKSKEDKHKLVINEECAEVVREIYELALQGKSPLQISYVMTDNKVKTPSQIMNMQQQTTKWYPEVIRRILRNEMYIGNMVQCKKRKINYKLKKVVDAPKEEWIIVENTHEAIIEKKKFYAVQEILKSRETTRKKKLDLLLRGLVVCKDCGKKMTTTADHKGNHTRYLRCTSYATAPRQRICTPHLVNYRKVENAVIFQIQEICKEYLDKNKIKQIVDIENQEIEKSKRIKREKSIISKALEVIEIQIDKVYEDKLNGLISNEDFKRIYDNKITERNKKQKQLQELNNISNEKEIVDYEKIMSDFLKKENITNYMLTALIDKIEIDNNKQVTIHYKFNPLNNLS